MKSFYRIGTFLFPAFVLPLTVLAQNRVPTEERPVGRLDLSVNRINYLHQEYPFLDGLGRVVSVKELHFDTTDLDLLGKNIDVLERKSDRPHPQVRVLLF